MSGTWPDGLLAQHLHFLGTWMDFNWSIDHFFMGLVIRSIIYCIQLEWHCLLTNTTFCGKKTSVAKSTIRQHTYIYILYIYILYIYTVYIYTVYIYDIYIYILYYYIIYNINIYIHTPYFLGKTHIFFGRFFINEHSFLFSGELPRFPGKLSMLLFDSDETIGKSPWFPVIFNQSHGKSYFSMFRYGYRYDFFWYVYSRYVFFSGLVEISAWHIPTEIFGRIVYLVLLIYPPYTGKFNPMNHYEVSPIYPFDILPSNISNIPYFPWVP